MKRILLILALGLSIAPLAHAKLPDLSLIDAAKANNVDRVQQLLAAGALVDQADRYSWTALIYAAQKGYEPIVQLLIDAGASVNQPDKNGWTALMAAARNGHEPTVRLLIAAGASVNQSDANGWTALIKAAENGHVSIVRLLLSAGASVILTDKNGWTALRSAAQNGHEAICILLIEHMFKIPSDAQKQKIYTTLLSLKHAGLPKDMRNYMKHFLLDAVEAENRGENFKNSVAKREIDKIGNKGIKQRLLAKYSKNTRDNKVEE